MRKQTFVLSEFLERQAPNYVPPRLNREMQPGSVGLVVNKLAVEERLEKRWIEFIDENQLG